MMFKQQVKLIPIPALAQAPAQELELGEQSKDLQLVCNTKLQLVTCNLQ